MIDAEQRQMINDCWIRRAKLNAFELEYIETFVRWTQMSNSRYTITYKQMKVLQQIWDRVT